MKFSTALSFFATVASSVSAVKFTNSEVQPVAGEAFTLNWTGANGTVDLYIVTGPTELALTSAGTIASKLPLRQTGFKISHVLTSLLQLISRPTPTPSP